MDSSAERYLNLWKRLDAVVNELTGHGQEETADYLAFGFFMNFSEFEELERFVAIAEHSPDDLGLREDSKPKARPITEASLAAMERRCDATTPEPWVAYIEGRDHESGSDFVMRGPPDDRGDDLELSGATKADIDFIAEARRDMPRLIAEVRRLRALLASDQLTGA